MNRSKSIKTSVKIIAVVVALICIVLFAIINFALYYFYGEFPDAVSEVMPEDTKIKYVNIYTTGNYIDVNNTLWATGREYAGEKSLGLKNLKGVNKPVRVAENILKASDSFFITTNNELWAWNYVPYITGVSQNTFEKTPVYVTDNVSNAFCLSDGVIIQKTSGSLFLAGKDTFTNSEENYTIQNLKLLAENVKNFWCVENYNAHDSIYIIDNENKLYVMGGKEGGSASLGEKSYADNLTFLAENVKKVEGQSSKMYYLTYSGELYSLGNGSDAPNLYKTNVVDFTGGNILYYIDDSNALYKCRNDNVIGVLENKDIRQISAFQGVLAVLTSNGSVLISGDDNHELIIPTYNISTEFENPVILQESVDFDFSEFILKYGFAVLGVLVIIFIGFINRR